MKSLNSFSSQLKMFKDKYEKELESLKEKRRTKQKEIDEYKNVDGKREELLQKMKILETENAALDATLESTESAVIEAERRNEELIVINFTFAYKMFFLLFFFYRKSWTRMKRTT